MRKTGKPNRWGSPRYTRYIDPEPPFEQVFDLHLDPNQLRNLADLPAHAELLQTLRSRCDQLAEEVGQTGKAP